MTPTPHRRAFTLAIHPSSRGFAWVVAESPLSVVDWGIAEVTGGHTKNAACLTRITRIIDRYGPETIVLEAFCLSTTRRHARVARLCKAIAALAMSRSIDVAVYTRADIQGCFAQYGARTREQIAATVAQHVEPLRRYLPRQRRPWESEDRRLVLFAAAAQVLTHYNIECGRLLADAHCEG